MKKDIIKWMMGYACFLAFVSCSQTEEGMQLRNENGIRFSARIASPATRVTEQAFEPGDNISVFAFTDNQGFLADAYAANVKYSYSDGAFRPAAEEGIAYPTNGGLAFWAIYPYCEQAASTFNFEVAEDQSTAAAYGTSDLMTASTSLTTEQNPALSFYHRLACVKFKYSFKEAEEKVTSITVNNVQKNVSIDLSNNTYEGAGEMIPGLLPYRNDDGSYKILLPPQTIATGTPFMVVRTTAGKEYTWKVPRDLQLASGCRYTYNLKVSAGGEIVFSSSINPWNQKEELASIIPPYILDSLQNHMPIYLGDTPPFIEGSYRINPTTFAYHNSAYGFSTFDGNEVVWFLDQDAVTRQIKVRAKRQSHIDNNEVNSYSQFGEDKTTYISGTGNNFTVYSAIGWRQAGHYDENDVFIHEANTKNVLVYSGTLTEDGISNLYWSKLLVKKERVHPTLDWPNAEGAFAIQRDKDGTSEKIDLELPTTRSMTNDIIHTYSFDSQNQEIWKVSGCIAE